MEKYNENIRELFICECNSPSHQMIFSYDKDFESVLAHIHLIPQRNIFKRIWIGIKYILGLKIGYGDYDEFIFNKDESYKLAKILKYLDGTNLHS